ncbi:MAG: hypothetical protein M0026_16155 [Nocardiopsaceae bacterium]|nr:hypothetical protein [Nocardiopsaceae bacterium]
MGTATSGPDLSGYAALPHRQWNSTSVLVGLLLTGLALLIAPRPPAPLPPHSCGSAPRRTAAS